LQVCGNTSKADVVDIPLYLETPVPMKNKPFMRPLYTRVSAGMELQPGPLHVPALCNVMQILLFWVGWAPMKA
jgi:hypothetical protein